PTSPLFPYTTLFRSDDAVPHADVLGLRGTGREEHLRRRAVRIFFQEVVLDGPDLVKPQLIGKAHLFERVHINSTLGFSLPGPREDRKSTRLNSSHRT